MLRTLAHLFLQDSTVFSPPFNLSPSISLATWDHVEFLKFAPSPASDLCLSRHVTRAVSSSDVQIARSFCALLPDSGLELPCLLHVAMYTWCWVNVEVLRRRRLLHIVFSMSRPYIIWSPVRKGREIFLNTMPVYWTKCTILVMGRGQPWGLKGLDRFISYGQPLNNIQRLRQVVNSLCHYSPRVWRVTPGVSTKGQNVGILELIFYLFTLRRECNQTT